MDRLSHVIVFTGDVAGLKDYYESLGLVARPGSPEWVELDTAGATLVLQAAPDSARRGIELRFTTADLAARVQELEGRGIKFAPTGIERSAGGRLARLSDPEGRRLTLCQPSDALPRGSGPALSVVANCRDMASAKAFYRDTLGFATTIDSPWWVQLAVGPATMGLHPRTDRPGAEQHHALDLTIGLSIPDLGAWHEEAVERGVVFKGPPTDRGFGTFADADDPDGNSLTFRDVPDAGSLEEDLAEPFENDAAPQRSAFRKPVKKGATTGSRLVLKTVHKGKKAAGKRRHPAKPASRVASPRGTGPAGTRQKPKRARDTKRARSKPAIGRLHKAERRTFKTQRDAVAGASKSKPVKRASRVRTVKRSSTRTAARARTRR